MMTTQDRNNAQTSLTLLATGGPTALIEFGGLRLVTDPTFDAPRQYDSGTGIVLTKTAPAARSAAGLGAVDAVLLTHDQHPDNLDLSGGEFLHTVPVTLTTQSGARRLAAWDTPVDAVALAPWSSYELARPGGGALEVTAVPALHGPVGCEPVTGEVIGFVLRAADLPTVYVSGDNASLGVVREIADRVGPVDIAILFAGAASLPIALDGALLTLDSAMAAEAAALLGARKAIVLHCNSWAHFHEGAEELRLAFGKAGRSELLEAPAPGETVRI